MWVDKSEMGSRHHSTLHQFVHSTGQYSKILVDFGSHVFPIEGSGRVVAHDVVTLIMGNQTPACLADALDPEELLGGDTAKQHDDHGVDERNLLHEVMGYTGIPFAFVGGAILGRTAFDNVSDKEFLAIEAVLCQYPIQKTPGSSDKGVTTQVLFPAWGFANEHHLCRWFAVTRNGMGTGGVQWAARAVTDLLGQFCESASLH
jgi:hypothetical protein